MADSFRRLVGMLVDDDNRIETTPQHNNPMAAGAGAGVPRSNEAAAQDMYRPVVSYNNSGTQVIRGLINNTGYTKGNGNGSIIFGGFDTSTRN